MTIIIDRRQTKSNKNAINRKKFLDRYRKHVQKSVDKAIKDKGIEDFNKPIDIVVDSIDEKAIDYDKATGERESVSSGNEDYKKGDKIRKPSQGSGKGGQKGDSGEDEYHFTLTKEEFFNIFFEDLDLPDFIKESMIDTTKMVHKRSGYIKDGLPCRLDIRKTMEMALGRRISNKNSDKKQPYIDDIDLRFKHFKTIPQPMLQATVFLLMDVSGSMGAHEKMLAKKFFIFLYLFLTKNYEKVNVRFIRYHHNVRECDEETFFYAKDTGGTDVSQALEFVNNIIDNEINLSQTNVYIAHASDGDCGYGDQPERVQKLILSLLDKIQYYAYLEVMDEDGYEIFQEQLEDGSLIESLIGVLALIADKAPKLGVEYAVDAEDIYPVLRKLFHKRK